MKKFIQTIFIFLVVFSEPLSFAVDRESWPPKPPLHFPNEYRSTRDSDLLRKIPVSHPDFGQMMVVNIRNLPSHIQNRLAELERFSPNFWVEPSALKFRGHRLEFNCATFAIYHIFPTHFFPSLIEQMGVSSMSARINLLGLFQNTRTPMTGDLVKFKDHWGYYLGHGMILAANGIDGQFLIHRIDKTLKVYGNTAVFFRLSDFVLAAMSESGKFLSHKIINSWLNHESIDDLESDLKNRIYFLESIEERLAPRFQILLKRYQHHIKAIDRVRREGILHRGFVKLARSAFWDHRETIFKIMVNHPESKFYGKNFEESLKSGELDSDIFIEEYDSMLKKNEFRLLVLKGLKDTTTYQTQINFLEEAINALDPNSKSNDALGPASNEEQSATYGERLHEVEYWKIGRLGVGFTWKDFLTGECTWFELITGLEEAQKIEYIKKLTFIFSTLIGFGHVKLPSLFSPSKSLMPIN